MISMHITKLDPHRKKGVLTPFSFSSPHHCLPQKIAEPLSD